MSRDLPPINAASVPKLSLTEKTCWNKNLLTFQRRSSVDNIQSEPRNNNLFDMQKSTSKPTKSLPGKSFSDSQLSNSPISSIDITRRHGVKSGRSRTTLRNYNAPIVFSDNKTLLRSAETLEQLKKLKLDKFTRSEISQIEKLQNELLVLTQNKCFQIAKKECLSCLHNAKTYVKDLQAQYNEECHKLEVLSTVSKRVVDERRKTKIVEGFIKCSSSKKSLPEEVFSKSKDWLQVKQNSKRIFATTQLPAKKCSVLLGQVMKSLNIITLKVMSYHFTILYTVNFILFVLTGRLLG